MKKFKSRRAESPTHLIDFKFSLSFFRGIWLLFVFRAFLFSISIKWMGHSGLWPRLFLLILTLFYPDTNLSLFHLNVEMDEMHYCRKKYFENPRLEITQNHKITSYCNRLFLIFLTLAFFVTILCTWKTWGRHPWEQLVFLVVMCFAAWIFTFSVAVVFQGDCNLRRQRKIKSNNLLEFLLCLANPAASIWRPSLIIHVSLLWKGGNAVPVKFCPPKEL